MLNPLYIIKIGGEVIDSDIDLPIFLRQFSEIKERKILIHGGGKLATTLAKQLNIPQTLIEGRRITDEKSLEIVTMVYAGLINKKLVAQLQALATNAFGLSGTDGNLIECKKREIGSIDYGFVGDIVSLNTNLLIQFIEQDITPVICPITHNKKGQLFNTNADSITNYIAAALLNYYNIHLIYCFDKKGVLLDLKNENSLIKQMDFTNYQNLKIQSIIHSGMIPKLDNAFEAKKKGIQKVYLGKAIDLSNLINNSTGTEII